MWKYVRKGFSVDFRKILYKVMTHHRNNGTANSKQNISMLFHSSKSPCQETQQGEVVSCLDFPPFLGHIFKNAQTQANRKGKC